MPSPFLKHLLAACHAVIGFGALYILWGVSAAATVYFQ